MRKEFLIGSILALGMGIAQAQTMPAPMQGGMQSPSRPDAGQAQPGTPPPSAGSTGPVSTVSSQNNAPQSFTGCLTRNSNGWSLATDNGNTVSVNGTDNQLTQFSNQQVNIQGVQASDGSISVSSINKVSDSCSNSTQAAPSSASAAQGSGTESSPTGAATGESNAVTGSQNGNGTAAQTAPSAAERPGVVPSNPAKTGTLNPPPGTPAITSETAPTSVGTGAASDKAVSPGTEAGAPGAAPPQETNTQQGTAEPSAAASSNPGQSEPSNNPPQSTNQAGVSSQNNSTTSNETNPGATASNNDQNAGVGQSGANSNQNAGVSAANSSNQNGVTSTTDQNGVRHITDLPQNGQQTGRLPQTASPLPLLGLLGIGSLGVGFLSRRKK